MSTKITCSNPFYNLSYNQSISQKSHFSYSRPVLCRKSHLKKINKPLNFVNSNAKNEILTVKCNSANSTGSDAPPPGKSPFFGWKWLLGFLLPIILPSFRNKVSPLQLLKNNVKQAVETVENMSEIVEEVAEKVDKIAEEIEEKLPGDSKLKQSLDSIENLAEGAVKYANQAQDVIQKIKDMDKEMDTLIHTNNANQVEKVSQELSAKKN
ncbi:uncharacterized protein LOC107800444 [Nicotiana tabacum]|uniref:Uncharacterized protein LOC107800444 n=1 Tax=Nicotiana tabacum TaxID=4097 RepID=A0A1S4ARH6_TOBAC|nr:uncharacterized protein LOC104110192 [Nicotiana tomentosiformis]XP_016479098.1 PREDICTED: uncharacterized protein LOC107800444 [Nicotiana tabacum]XP_018631132.1 uncharacterized protein LOC104110192 [Nicotiana tomentosiformis]